MFEANLRQLLKRWCNWFLARFGRWVAPWLFNLAYYIAPMSKAAHIKGFEEDWSAAENDEKVAMLAQSLEFALKLRWHAFVDQMIRGYKNLVKALNATLINMRRRRNRLASMLIRNHPYLPRWRAAVAVNIYLLRHNLGYTAKPELRRELAGRGVKSARKPIFYPPGPAFYFLNCIFDVLEDMDDVLKLNYIDFEERLGGPDCREDILEFLRAIQANGHYIEEIKRLLDEAEGLEAETDIRS